MEKNGLNDGILSNKSLNYDNKVEYFLEIVNEWDQYFLTTIDNKNIFDFVGKFENYANDVRSSIIHFTK